MTSRRGARKPIYGMGRHNHENNVAIPGFTSLVMLSGDDTFTSNPPQSQLYAYIAPNTDAVWNDTGELYGFKANDPAINDYYDVPVGSTTPVPGTFVKINKTDAVGNQTVARERIRRARGLPVRPARGHRLRQAAGHEQRRSTSPTPAVGSLRCRLRRRPRGQFDERPDLEDWSSIRWIRRRARCPCSWRATTSRSRRPTRSTSPTTSRRPGTVCT